VQTEWQTAGEPYPAPFDHEFFLILNLAVGGEWPGSPDETTVFPQTLAVDYVRVYQEQATPEETAPEEASAADETSAPTEAVAVSVDATEPLHTISPYVYGVNHGPWALIPADYVDDIATLGATYIRFPGGNWGDDHQIREMQMGDIIFWADRMGADVAVSVNLREGTPEEAAALVEYANIEQEYGIRYWSIGNEPNLFGEEWDTGRYNAEWRRFAEAMLAVDPTIRFIGPDISQYQGDPSLDPQDENGVPWLESFLEANGDLVEIVSVHRYPFPSFGQPTTSVADLRSSTLEWQTIIPTLRETVRSVTGEDKPIAVTEINSHWSNVVAVAASPDSHFNAIWWADVLGQLIAQDTEIVAYFSLQSNNSIGGYGLYARFDVRPTYYVYKLYQHFGEEYLATETSHQFVNAYAARREDGRISLILVNLTDEAQTAQVNLAGEAAMMALTPETVPEDFSTLTLEGEIDLPAQSVTLLLVMPDA